MIEVKVLVLLFMTNVALCGPFRTDRLSDLLPPPAAPPTLPPHDFWDRFVPVLQPINQFRKLTTAPNHDLEEKSMGASSLKNLADNKILPSPPPPPTLPPIDFWDLPDFLPNQFGKSSCEPAATSSSQPQDTGRSLDSPQPQFPAISSATYNDWMKVMGPFVYWSTMAAINSILQNIPHLQNDVAQILQGMDLTQNSNLLRPKIGEETRKDSVIALEHEQPVKSENVDHTKLNEFYSKEQDKPGFSPVQEEAVKTETLKQQIEVGEEKRKELVIDETVENEELTKLETIKHKTTGKDENLEQAVKILREHTDPDDHLENDSNDELEENKGPDTNEHEKIDDQDENEDIEDDQDKHDKTNDDHGEHKDSELDENEYIEEKHGEQFEEDEGRKENIQEESKEVKRE